MRCRPAQPGLERIGLRKPRRGRRRSMFVWSRLPSPDARGMRLPNERIQYGGTKSVRRETGLRKNIFAHENLCVSRRWSDCRLCAALAASLQAHNNSIILFYLLRTRRGNDDELAGQNGRRSSDPQAAEKQRVACEGTIVISISKNTSQLAKSFLTFESAPL